MDMHYENPGEFLDLRPTKMCTCLRLFPVFHSHVNSHSASTMSLPAGALTFHSREAELNCNKTNFLVSPGLRAVVYLEEPKKDVDFVLFRFSLL